MKLREQARKSQARTVTEFMMKRGTQSVPGEGAPVDSEPLTYDEIVAALRLARRLGG